MAARSDSLGDSPPDHIQDFIFLRELSEVYLLLDHVSGRSDKHLTDTNLGQGVGASLPTDWLEQVCLIGWPPVGSDAKRADQAAILLRVKDMLNAAARPASGATIAFTLLVSGEDNADPPTRNVMRGWLKQVFHCAYQRTIRKNHDRDPSGSPKAASHDSPGEQNAGANPPRASAPPSGWGQHPPSRRSLARLAYPGLVTNAQRFTWQIRAIIVLLLAWLIVTCSLSWNVAAGQVIFRRADQVRAKQEALLKEISSAEANALKPGHGTDTPPTTSTRSIGVILLQDCVWYPPTAQSSNSDESQRLTRVEDIELCDDIRQQSREHAVIQENLADWLAPWRWLKGVAHVVCRGSCLPNESGFSIPPAAAVNKQWAAIVLEVLASAVLPLCYGFLGAGAAVVRDLWGKMRESLLSPRDLTLALGQLALGAVIGASIGLFIAPASAPTAGSNAFIASTALTGSALSFIAGFGVEGVFVALEGLIKRLFNLPGAVKK
jgi:hypothetical protein